MSELVKSDFFTWADGVLTRPVPKNTVAFHFNLYQGNDSVHIQLMGIDSFEGSEDYWPGAKTYSTGEDVFHVPFESAGVGWPEWLESLKRLVSDYIAYGKRSDVLRSTKGVGIGFVDGDMYVLWQSAA
jgi:hypothetical protein